MFVQSVLLFCILFVSLRFSSCIDPNEFMNLDTLKFVHVIFRHGDRAPLNTFPSDTSNNETTWSMGWGQVTQLGLRQNYNLGKWLRSRYNGFISANYLNKEIYVRSTGFDRTIMSAMATVAGLYATADSGQTSEEAIVFQAVPIHSRPKDDDPMLYTSTNCPTADKLFATLQSSEEVMRIENEHADLLNFLSVKTGYDKKISLDPEIRSIYDTLYIEWLHRNSSVDDNGHDWPTWMNDTIWQQIVKLNGFATKYKFYTAELQKLRGGLILGDILERMKNRTSEHSSQKVYAYSAHETTMLALLANLGYLTDRIPSYSSAIVLELHEMHVEVYYRHEIDSIDKLETVNVSGCFLPCSLTQFAKRSEYRIPKDWYSECGRNDRGCTAL